MRWFASPRRGIEVLALAIVLGGIFTLWFGGKIGQSPELAGLDLLSWLLVPAIFAAIYLTFGRIWRSAGLSPRLRGNGRWFLLAATLPVAISGVLVVISWLGGLITVTFGAMTAGAAAGAAGLGVFAAKNVIEEFIFRGFLTGRFAETRLAGLPGHVLTGLLWATWHLVYWFTLLPEGKIDEVSGLSTPVFVAFGFVALTFQSILLGELRLVTGSIWAGWLLHTINNVLLAGLVAANAVPRGDFVAMLVTPVDFGLIYTGGMALVGLFVWRWRVVTQPISG